MLASLLDFSFIFAIAWVIAKATGLREELKVEDSVGCMLAALMGYAFLKLIALELFGGMQWPPVQDDNMSIFCGSVAFGIYAGFLGFVLWKKKRHETE